jgi:hypothetical protein
LRRMADLSRHLFDQVSEDLDFRLQVQNCLFVHRFLVVTI